MPLNPILKDNAVALIKLCREKRVKKLYVFGSVVTDRFDPKTSDIDFIVELEEMPAVEKGETLLTLWDEFEDLFQRKVDLLTDEEIVNPYLKRSIEASKLLIYDRSGKEILI